MTSVAYMLLIGFIVGVLARFIYPGRQSMSWIWTIVLGIAGALVAGWGGRALGLYAEGQPASFVSSVLGALVLLFIYNRMVVRK
jgi:uncharacterized membrane protein YeaQ/YmgE (transglycosylase-associated protein family)